MDKFTHLKAITAPLAIDNVHTDMIAPKPVLKAITRSGLAWGLFQEMRQNEHGVLFPDFVLNREPWKSRAKILVTMENFGCGSSREHAPWCLLDFGFRAIIAVSFADIFFNNCFKNGMLPLTLPKPQVERVMKDADAGIEVTIDLPAQEVRLADGTVFKFEVDGHRKHCLVEGLDDIGLTLMNEGKITAFEKSSSNAQPWLYDLPAVAAAKG